MTKNYNIAVVGATGSVGRETLKILAEQAFPVNNIYAAGSSSSIGRELSFGEKVIAVSALESLDFSQVDLAFFCAGSKISQEYAPKAADCRCIVIDKSSFFRLDPDVPLIVPEANIVSLKHYQTRNIIASPNCCTIPLAVILKPLDNAAKIKRIIISTYQAASGAGKDGMDELYNQTKGKYAFTNIKNSVFPKQIAFNLFPHIGDFDQDGTTGEEAKIALELQKIIGPHIKSSVTCVRVPVFVSHSMSVNVEFSQKMTAQEAEEILSDADGAIVFCLDNQEKYATPVEVVGEDSVYVSRIRDDVSQDNTINLWITCDNLRKGAALNAVQIAQELITNYLC